jgi:tRNA uridine 5-carboxymethylaminomethyl modification enzyme
VKQTAIARVLALLETTRVGEGSLVKLLRRPEVTWSDLVAHVAELAQVPKDVARQIEYDLKYEGYVARQEVEVSRLARLQEKRIPTSFDYSRLVQLRIEAREKFAQVRPITLAQASRISGITPADVAILLVHLSGG